MYFFKNLEKWKTRILIWHYSKNQSSIEYSLVRRCYNILRQNWCFQVLLFLIYKLEWNKLDRRIRQSTTMLSSRNALLKIGRPTPKPVCNILDPNDLTLLTRLRRGLSHLNKHKFNHNFKECVNPLCSSSLRLSLFPIFSCTVITSQILEKPFLMNYNQLIKIF